MQAMSGSYARCYRTITVAQLPKAQKMNAGPLTPRRRGLQHNFGGFLIEMGSHSN